LALSSNDLSLEVVRSWTFLSSWSTTGIFDLKEWVVMIETLFAFSTVVKVYAYAALVADSFDWVEVASITSNIYVCHIFLEFPVFKLVDIVFDAFAPHELVISLA